MARFDVVFEGGGAKGVAFAGALEVLAARGHELGRVVGASAGAIAATLSAAGYSPAELVAASTERENGKHRFARFLDLPAAGDGLSRAVCDRTLTMSLLRKINVPFLPSRLEEALDRHIMDALLRHRVYGRVFSFLEHGGFYAGREFVRWLEEKLAAKGIVKTDTLWDFARQTRSDLSLIVSDTTDMEMLVLNHRTAPLVPVTQAVRMSMSIPLVWQEVVWKEEWGQYLGRPKAGNVMVDGGMLSNFPIRLIAERDEFVETVMGEPGAGDGACLGLLIDETLPVAGAENTARTPLTFSSLEPVRRVGRLLDTLTGAWDNHWIRRHARLICRLPAKGYGTLEFDMQAERLEKLLDAAREAAAAHLDARARAGESGI